MSKTSYLLALTLILGAVVVNSSSKAEAQNIDKFCSKFSKKISQGKAYEANGRKLALYRSYCLGRRSNNFSADPGNYSYTNGNGYTYTRGSTTSSDNVTGYSRSTQSTYSSNTTNGGYTQQSTSQTNNSDDPYADYGYNDRPSINVATPNSQVRVQNGGVTIRTPGTGINLGF
ncbi:MAG: hypothetical protein WCA07_17935 [Gloeobacterales cyanobacterium]